MSDEPGKAGSRRVQVLAVLGLVPIWAMVFHKATVDLTALAQKHSGMQFLKSLAQYLIRNLAGGGS